MTRDELIPHIIAHLKKPNGDRIYMLPANIPNLRHGDLYIYDGAICEFLLSEKDISPEEAELAQDIWENGY